MFEHRRKTMQLYFKGGFMTTVYEKPNCLKISYNPEKNYVICNWDNYTISLEEIKEGFQKALDAAKANKCYFYIAETSKVKNVIRQEIIEWWGGTYIPELVKYGIKAIVTVVPSSALATLSNKDWQKQVIGGIAMFNVKTLAEAETELAKL
jgi:hypothetical protein